MATLKEVADLAAVPILDAFAVLKGNGNADALSPAVRQRILQSAALLKYKLKITQIDVADLANVAKGTVSYALNDSDLISPATTARVREAARVLGYRLNTTARNLRTNQTGVIGYSWHVADDPSRMNNLLDRFIYRVTMTAEERGFHMLIFVQPKIDADKVYETLISTNRLDGFILSDVNYGDPRVERLHELGAPFVAFGGMDIPDATFAYVDVDSKKGIEIVVDHLVAQGHQRIGLLTYEQTWPFSVAREVGYHEAMHRAGLTVQPEWITRTPNILRSAASATQHLLSGNNAPTAIICANDIMAFGAKTYFDEAGLRMGADIALTGYDDDPTSEFLGITSVRQPIDAVADGVFDLLYGEINNEPRPQRQIILEPHLIIRHSTTD